MNDAHRCDNCDITWAPDVLVNHWPNIPGLTIRVEPGGTVPSGECPDCGALCYPVPDPKEGV